MRGLERRSGHPDESNHNNQASIRETEANGKATSVYRADGMTIGVRGSAAGSCSAGLAVRNR
jgi:hypothetical protein